ncbi:hypothetical protein TDE_0141 [Treponema denticola ATCC 35405]|uniref:Uncharacterized protein n=1 Tax=Treponema denticola (strain ATCC 35405 / DSM 14222 / CIP 103919 / JCM 8153 / KCTC 15104) TaxID=243275 RepID=Q73RE8_TREDE|nr:hypothetical protein TDE_0141 [Treponema denticola ATCC 35405]
MNFYFSYAKLTSAGVLLQAENIPAKGCPHGCPIT